MFPLLFRRWGRASYGETDWASATGPGERPAASSSVGLEGIPLPRDLNGHWHSGTPMVCQNTSTRDFCFLCLCVSVSVCLPVCVHYSVSSPHTEPCLFGPARGKCFIQRSESACLGRTTELCNHDLTQESLCVPLSVPPAALPSPSSTGVSIPCMTFGSSLYSPLLWALELLLPLHRTEHKLGL